MSLLYYYKTRLYAAIMDTDKKFKKYEILHTLTNKEIPSCEIWNNDFLWIQKMFTTGFLQNTSRQLSVKLVLFFSSIRWHIPCIRPHFLKNFNENLIFVQYQHWKNILSKKTHCVKSVQIRSYFWSEYRKIRARHNSVFWHFSRSDRFIVDNACIVT